MSGETPGAVAARLERRLLELGSRERAAGAKAYLKSPLEFVGVDTPTLRREVRRLLRERRDATKRELLALVRALWARPVFELRAFAIELLTARQEALTPVDLPLVERLLRESGTWALVDAIAPRVVGPLFERAPERVGPVLDRWAEDDDFWLRRAALLALLVPLRRGGGDWPRFVRYADGMLGEREFFLRKAIGWVLREVAKTRPERVVEFLSPRMARVSGLTLREATKHLSRRQRLALGSPRAATRRGASAGRLARRIQLREDPPRKR
jgi:3-methyladenine DNA glycosylase AlkD